MTIFTAWGWQKNQDKLQPEKQLIFFIKTLKEKKNLFEFLKIRDIAVLSVNAPTDIYVNLDNIMAENVLRTTLMT